MRWVSHRSWSGGNKPISSCINNFSLHFLFAEITCAIAAVNKPIGSPGAMVLLSLRASSESSGPHMIKANNFPSPQSPNHKGARIVK